MADFRTKLIGLSAATLMFSGMAFGQLCNSSNTLTLANGLTNNVRAEGQTELLPQLTLSCSTNNTSASTFTVLVQIPNVPITSKITATSNNTTEISLTAGSNATLGQATYFGTLSGNVVTFSNVVATPTVSGTAATFTIANIRVNASSLPSAGAFPSSITAQSFVQGTTNTTTGQSGGALTVAYAFSALNDPTKVYTTAAYATSGVAVGGAVTASPTFQVCFSNNTSSSTGSATAAFFISVQENFAGAFKTLAHETGPGAGASAASSSTRVKLVFNNIPTGLSLYVPVSITNGNLATINLTASETGAYSAVAAATTPSAVNTLGLAPVTISGTSGTVIYDVQADNVNVVNNFPVPVYLVAGANTVTNYLTNPTMTVTTSLAPQPATAGSQIPSFSPTASDILTANTVTFAPCTTNLLFPFVTNANGFETGIAISNTTKDPFKTTGQSGTCTLNYYATGVSGATNPTAVVAPNLAEGANQPFLAGETYAFTLTQSLGVNAANPATFQGYVIAQCNFVDAHAFAYILGGLQPGMFVNPNNTAMGYLALVMTGRGGGTVDAVTF